MSSEERVARNGIYSLLILQDSLKVLPVVAESLRKCYQETKGKCPENWINSRCSDSFQYCSEPLDFILSIPCEIQLDISETSSKLNKLLEPVPVKDRAAVLISAILDMYPNVGFRDLKSAFCKSCELYKVTAETLGKYYQNYGESCADIPDDGFNVMIHLEKILSESDVCAIADDGLIKELGSHIGDFVVYSGGFLFRMKTAQGFTSMLWVAHIDEGYVIYSIPELSFTKKIRRGFEHRLINNFLYKMDYQVHPSVKNELFFDYGSSLLILCGRVERMSDIFPSIICQMEFINEYGGELMEMVRYYLDDWGGVTKSTWVDEAWVDFGEE